VLPRWEGNSNCQGVCWKVQLDLGLKGPGQETASVEPVYKLGPWVVAVATALLDGKSLACSALKNRYEATVSVSEPYSLVCLANFVEDKIVTLHGC
jgi:hypothetical protein